ncbi:sigma-54 interaction domain-containing protein [Neofamilia massiliensis]|uniref:sigma-54 interaction domain-containing protein n=1 Tax=Neofamilia massiliensis TaxID=1673724 RepID=UPI0006BB7B88|nr:sigma-54-dependent Fis family transcriptional regulator [Neofamilia massiliensis]
MKEIKFIDIFNSEKLEENPKFHQDLMDFFDSLADGILITDSNGKIIIYNRAKEIQENRDRKDMLGKYTWETYGYSGPENSEHYEVLKSQKPILNKYSAHSKLGGVERYISYSTYPIILDGKTIAVYTVGRSEDSLHQVLVDTIEKKRKHNASLEKDLPVYAENGTRYTFSNIVGDSEEIKNVINIAQNVSFLDNSILIIGETGTGKEVLSQSIHNFGDRSKEPFIGINCSAIPENLLESMLFGTVRGAYTGAVDSKGLFEKAKGGTLFLDDINTMPMGLQAKLLRALQEKRVTRVGDSQAYPIQCRIVSATNEDPFDLIQKGKLREDLYYRIAGFTINIPPLRDRKKDIIILIEYFIRRYNKPLGKPHIGIDSRLKKILDSYPWPGNIRELENLVENMLVNSSGDSRYLTVENIPAYLKERFLGEEIKPEKKKEIERLSFNDMVDDFERELLRKYLEENSWNYSKTARVLDLNRNSLLYKIKRLGLEND